MSNIAVEIVSADKTIYHGEGSLISATATSGEVGIMRGHTPLLAALKPGYVSIKHDNNTEDELIFISGGFIEVQPSKVTILADTAERAEDLDEEAAKEAIAKAETDMQSLTGVDYTAAQRVLIESQVRLNLVKKLRNRRK